MLMMPVEILFFFHLWQQCIEIRTANVKRPSFMLEGGFQSFDPFGVSVECWTYRVEPMSLV